MSLLPKIYETIRDNDHEVTAGVLAQMIKDNPSRVESILFFALEQAERKGAKQAATILAKRAAQIVANIEVIDALQKV